MKRSALFFIGISVLLLGGMATAQDPAQYTFTINANYQNTNLMHPTGLWVDGTDVYIADTDHHQIKLFKNGTLTTIAGTGAPGYVNGLRLYAQFNRPTGISGQSKSWRETPLYCCNPICPLIYGPCPTITHYYKILYVNDTANFVVRRICLGDPPQTGECNVDNVDTVGTASGNNVRALVDGPNLNASFAEVGGLVPSYDIADPGNHSIRAWNLSSVTTFAGTGQEGLLDGFRTSALFRYPVKTASDLSGNRYVTDAGNSAIRKIDSNGYVTTLAGTGMRGYLDGPASVAQFDTPTGMVYHSTSNSVFVADTLNNCVRKIDAGGNVTTYAGTTDAGSTDGALGQARFTWPTEMVISGDSIYVSDTLNNAIRKINMSTGSVTTLVH